jgi:hypothetical protein
LVVILVVHVGVAFEKAALRRDHVAEDGARGAASSFVEREHDPPARGPS